jgi:hypothetical protein
MLFGAGIVLFISRMEHKLPDLSQPIISFAVNYG